MSVSLKVLHAGPGLSVQDLGRAGWMEFGVSRGGAVDPDALYEGAALLGQDAGLAAIEMQGVGGVFEADADVAIALTGAPMRAKIDGKAVRWNASHPLSAGARLEIGAVETGHFGYLHVSGGVATPVLMGARAAHLVAGIGRALQAGDALPIGAADGTRSGYKLPAFERSSAREIRVVRTVHTDLFDDAALERFESERFTRSAHGNRMGVKLEGAVLAARDGLSLLSETVVAGDIQVTGDGTPYVLLSECQTVGGYPRLASVIAADLPLVAQADVGHALCFRFVSLEEAIDIERARQRSLALLAGRPEPLIRDPHDIADLLSYQLISGVTAGDDAEPIYENH